MEVGTYNLEILQLSCRENAEELRTHCIPDTLDRITLNNPFQMEIVRVPNVTTGHWRNDDYYKLLQMQDTTFQSSLPTCDKVATRFQLDPLCVHPRGNCDLSWFDNFSFVAEHNDYFGASERLSNRTLCFVGDSHSRRIVISLKNLFTNITLKSHHVYLEYPSAWDSDAHPSRLLTLGCTDVVIAVGLWSLSVHTRGFPTPPHIWKENIFNMISSIVAANKTSSNTMNIILRKIHPIPLGYRRTTCPATEWHTPIYLDAYNQQLLELILENKETKIQLLDTYDLVGSVWDTSSDWNHFDTKVQTPETLHILNEISKIPLDPPVEVAQ